jgi:hypothetical protein
VDAGRDCLTQPEKDADISLTIETAIDAVEGAYEFLLAYAAQGREDDSQGPGQKPRDTLLELDAALEGIIALLNPDQPFSDVVAEDAEKTRKALTLVLAQPRITSELIDNLNASMHLRAVLTDLFLLSEAMRISSGES